MISSVTTTCLCRVSWAVGKNVCGTTNTVTSVSTWLLTCWSTFSITLIIACKSSRLTEICSIKSTVSQSCQ